MRSYAVVTDAQRDSTVTESRGHARVKYANQCILLCTGYTRDSLDRVFVNRHEDDHRRRPAAEQCVCVALSPAVEQHVSQQRHLSGGHEERAARRSRQRAQRRQRVAVGVGEAAGRRRRCVRRRRQSNASSRTSRCRELRAVLRSTARSGHQRVVPARVSREGRERRDAGRPHTEAVVVPRHASPKAACSSAACSSAACGGSVCSRGAACSGAA